MIISGRASSQRMPALPLLVLIRPDNHEFRRTPSETATTYPAEAVGVGSAGEGPNLSTQGAVGNDSMGAERQQGRAYQLTFDLEGSAEAPHHDQGGDDGIRSVRCEEPQSLTASNPARAWTERLMEAVCRPEKETRAYRRVEATQGAPGTDGMTIGQLRTWIATRDVHRATRWDAARRAARAPNNRANRPPIPDGVIFRTRLRPRYGQGWQSGLRGSTS
jgi:hypothetical protein